jgi:exopolysaccharide biosynthesis polyprenyl glycosylphosphotransferase
VSRAYLITKRAIDIALSSLMLVLLSPIYLLVILLIKLDSEGPVFIRQQRVGRDGVTFQMLKFRSMCAQAELMRSQLQHLNEMSGPVFKVKKDPRVTRLGKYLRKYSVDELPQLVNVLRGEMSLVGPRPPLPREVELYEPWQLHRLDVEPGLTCLWQVNGRNHCDFDAWVRLDLEYIERRSLWLDLKILAKTIPAVVSGKGAY